MQSPLIAADVQSMSGPLSQIHVGWFQQSISVCWLGCVVIVPQIMPGWLEWVGRIQKPLSLQVHSKYHRSMGLIMLYFFIKVFVIGCQYSSQCLKDYGQVFLHITHTTYMFQLLQCLQFGNVAWLKLSGILQNLSYKHIQIPLDDILMALANIDEWWHFPD